MATIGQYLPQPEAGWRRYDDSDSLISYSKNWAKWSDGYRYGGSCTYTTTQNEKINFSFYGSKLRIIAAKGADLDNTDSLEIKINDVIVGNCNLYAPSVVVGQLLIFEYNGDKKINKVEITNKGLKTNIDAIDIDSDGYLITPVGSSLPNPEPGWRRFHHTHFLISYDSSWILDTNSTSGYYNNSAIFNNSKNNNPFSFYFYGSKIRVVNQTYSNRNKNVKISIDGEVYMYDSRLEVYGTSPRPNVLLFEKRDLNMNLHKVEIYGTDLNSSNALLLECIDVDDNGYLIPYIESKLKQKTSLQDMEIGDIIPCRYAAPTSGKLGYFSELGTCEADFINPQTSSATPDGKFYFVKVSDDKLIADRNVQHSITWNELNNNNIIDGDYLYKKYITFEKPNSYIWFDNSIVKNSVSSEFTVNIQIYKKDWTTGSSYNNGERIFSGTEAGGFQLCYDAAKKLFTAAINFSGVYYFLTHTCKDYLSGEVDLCMSYSSGIIYFYINKELASTSKISPKGAITHGGTNWFCIGAEPSSGSGVEPSAGPSIINAKISKFSLFNKCITPQEIPDIITGKEEGLVIGIDPNCSNSTYVKNLSSFGGYGTMVGCGFESNNKSVILTVPTGGVAYSEMGEEIFPVNALSSDEGTNYKLTTNSSLGSAVICYKAFNKSNVDDNDCWHSGAEAKPWLKIDFKDNPKIINEFVLTNRNHSSYPQSPISCEVLASNDDSTYTSLFTTATPSGSTTVSVYTFNNANSYRYYKFHFTSSSSGYTAVGELALYNALNYNGIKTFSYTNKNQGGYPISNDWDRYIWKSNLDGKITPSDDGIWNYSKLTNLVKERSLVNTLNIDGTSVSKVKCSTRGFCDNLINDSSAKRFAITDTTYISSVIGFRPMLILKEGE